MPKLYITKYLAIISIFGAVNVAFAQDAEWTDPPAAEQVNHFVTADVDASGMLSLDEFQVYAMSQADAGDKAYADLLTSGEFAKHFAAKDTDADGWLSEAELVPVEEETTMPDPNIIDNPDMIEE